MKRVCLFTLIAIVAMSGIILAESPPKDIRQQSYEAQWRVEMRLHGTHPDTIQMFLDAPESLPANDTTGLPILGTMCKVFNADKSKGWLWIVQQSADVKRTELSPTVKQYWSFVIKPVLVFDTQTQPFSKKE